MHSNLEIKLLNYVNLIEKYSKTNNLRIKMINQEINNKSNQLIKSYDSINNNNYNNKNSDNNINNIKKSSLELVKINS